MAYVDDRLQELTDRAASDLSERVRFSLLCEQATLLARVRRTQDADRVLSEAQKLARSARPDVVDPAVVECDLRYARASVLHAQGRSLDALREASAARDAAWAQRRERMAARCDSLVALLRVIQCDLDGALRAGLRALASALRIEDSRAQYQAALACAGVAVDCEALADADRLLTYARDGAGVLGDPLAAAAVNGSRVQVQLARLRRSIEQGTAEAALAALEADTESVLMTMTEAGFSAAPHVLQCTRAMILRRIGRLDEAISLLVQHLPVMERTVMPRELAQARMSLAMAMAQRRESGATDLALRAVDDAARCGDVAMHAQMHSGCALVFTYLNQPEVSFHHAKEAQQLRDQVQSRNQALQATLRAGLAALERAPRDTAVTAAA